MVTALTNAIQTIPDNLIAVADNILDPLGLNIGDVSDIEAASTEQEVNSGTFSAMQQSFDGQIGAFAYLLFILLYAPCVAATAAIYRETNLGWTVFVVCWTTGIAYTTAVIFYQLMTFSDHPEYSLTWIIGLSSVFLLVLAGLWFSGKDSNIKTPQEASSDTV